MSSAACIDPVSYTKITELRSRSDLCHRKSYQHALPRCSDILNNKKSGKHMPQYCAVKLLINFSLALLPVFLKTFLVDPGFVVKRDLDGNSHIQFSPYMTVLQIGTSGWSKLILSHPQMASAARYVVSVGRPIILTS